ncbi:hypothetical protein N0V94_003546 [Neodidymelliopsis sp. IMI 364377]|nr:hypothetical protein N0V94_003546 [Neodidymelliopsis sp. IMI 364377]
MYQLGQNFRGRYVASDGAAGLGRQKIANMSVDILNNDQISIQTLDTPYLVSSAQAFMQGMYPPNSIANATRLGDETGLLANGSVVQNPLDGYQYATVQSFSPYAYNSIYISGAQNCPMGKRQSMQYTVSAGFKQTKEKSKDVYETLQTSWFQGGLLDDQRNYDHALEIYDYLAYQFTHNRTIYERLTGNPLYTGVYNATRYYADEYAWNFWGNTAASTNDTDDQAIGGKTLAGEVVHQFQNLIAHRTNSLNANDDSHPVTLLFGEKDPFISLMSLMLMDSRDANFRAIPPFASAMVFELFSTGQNESFPQDESDLSVRFHYHNGTEDFAGQMMAFPMFNNGPSHTDMKWQDFQTMFSTIMMNTTVDWCETCSSPSLFCVGVDEDGILVSNPKSQQPTTVHHALSPAVAGVIGAVVTLAVAGLLFALAMLAGGVRFHRVQRRKPSALGGFKGSSKLASDADVANLSKGGAMPAGIVSFGATNTATTGDGDVDSRVRHERVGSWELRQKEFGSFAKSGDMGEAFPSPRESFERIDAIAGRPVQPREGV